jgi:hypothetical protein
MTIIIVNIGLIYLFDEKSGLRGSWECVLIGFWRDWRGSWTFTWSFLGRVAQAGAINSFISGCMQLLFLCMAFSH